MQNVRRRSPRRLPFSEFTELISTYFKYVYEYDTFNGEYGDSDGDRCEPHTASADLRLRTWCRNLKLDDNPLNLVGDPAWYSFDADWNVYVFNMCVQNLYTECLIANKIYSPRTRLLSINNVRRVCCEDATQLLQILKFLNTEFLMNFLVAELEDDLMPPLFTKVYNKAHARFKKNIENALNMRRALFRRQDRWLMKYHRSYSRNAVLNIDMHSAYRATLDTIKLSPEAISPPPPLGRTFTHIHLTIPSESSFCDTDSLIATKEVMNKWDWKKQWVEVDDKVTALENMFKTFTGVYVNQFPEESKRDSHRMGRVRWYDMLDDRDAATRLMDKIFCIGLDLTEDESTNGIFFVNEFTCEQRRVFIRTPTISDTSVANWECFYLKDVLTYFYGLGFANVVLMDLTCNTMFDTDYIELEGRAARHFYTSFVRSNSVDLSSLKKRDMNDRFNKALEDSVKASTATRKRQRKCGGRPRRRSHRYLVKKTGGIY